MLEMIVLLLNSDLVAPVYASVILSAYLLGVYQLMKKRRIGINFITYPGFWLLFVRNPFCSKLSEVFKLFPFCLFGVIWDRTFAFIRKRLCGCFDDKKRLWRKNIKNIVCNCHRVRY